MTNKENVNFRSLFSSYKYRSRQKKYDFNLTLEEFELMTLSDCFYCGTAPMNLRNGAKHSSYKNKSDHLPYKYNGLDRVDNSKGYTKENAVSCCSICNTAKHQMSKNEFYTWIHRVYLKSTLNL